MVVLETTKDLVKDDTKDTPIPLIIKAYATDDKDKIVVERKTTFVFPRYDVLLKKREQ